MTEDEYQRGQDRIDEAMSILREYFDTAFIMTSLHDGAQGTTAIWKDAIGCEYSLYGQFREHLMEVEFDMKEGAEMGFFMAPPSSESDDDDEGEPAWKDS